VVGRVCQDIMCPDRITRLENPPFRFKGIFFERNQ